MMPSFVGRRAELAPVSKPLERVAALGTGTAVAVRGRRQVGKSRLVQEFCNQAEVPYFFSRLLRALRFSSGRGARRDPVARGARRPV